MYEYQVIPAPTRAPKVKGVKQAVDRFAGALTELMNEAAADGWEYVRTDTLPLEETKGITRKATTTFQNLMVFRRALPGHQAQSPAQAMQQQMQHEQFAEPPLHRRPDLMQEADPFAEPEPRADEIRRQAPAPRVDRALEEDIILRGRSMRPDAPEDGYTPLGGVAKDDR